MKARDTISWQEHLFNLVNVVKEKSKDPSRQVGAVIINSAKRIIATGYNGFPSNCDEKYLSYKRPDKYGCIIHAEMNSILFAAENLEGTHLYTSNAPCEECLKHIVQAKISHVFYENASIMKGNASFHQLLAIRRLIKSSGIIVKNIDGLDYIDDLRPSFPFELFHPDGHFYMRNELREANAYLVYSNPKKHLLSIKNSIDKIKQKWGVNSTTDINSHDLNWIATIVIIAGHAYTQDGKRLEELLLQLNLTEEDIAFNRI